MPENVFIETVAENSPDLYKNMNTQVQEAKKFYQKMRSPSLSVSFSSLPQNSGELVIMKQ